MRVRLLTLSAVIGSGCLLLAFVAGAEAVQLNTHASLKAPRRVHIGERVTLLATNLIPGTYRVYLLQQQGNKVCAGYVTPPKGVSVSPAKTVLVGTVPRRLRFCEPAAGGSPGPGANLLLGRLTKWLVASPSGPYKTKAAYTSISVPVSISG